MLFRSYIPSPPLRDFVADFWLYDGYTGPHGRERILPSGTIELVINLREDELRIYDAARPDRCKRFSGALVSGAYSGFFVSDTAEEASIMGAHFRPGGALPFLGFPAGELADTHLDLETLWGRSAVTLRERLCGAAAPAERFRFLEEALVARLSRPPEHHYAVPAALEAFARMDARLTMREMIRRIGLSQRRFIQVFAAEVGMTPKVFSRVQRFHRALALARREVSPDWAPDWARLAIDCGYFDQSHLIRDFRAFSGFSPAGYLRHQSLLRQQGLHSKRHHIPLVE
jgi:AraC-like DNA-binding protein